MVGAAGRMGRLASAAIEATDDLDLAVRVHRGDSLDLLDGADVVVDLTVPDAVMATVRWCVDHDVNLVVGTSGFTEARLDDVRSLLVGHPRVGILVVPNFSIGAALMMRIAAQAAACFESVEIVEMHHDGKADAPSGTALRTAALVADARRDAGLGEPPDATRDDPSGARGGRASGIPVHSLRVRGAVAHQEVVLGNVGETLTIRHDMLDRAAAMPGLLACVRGIHAMPGLTVGLDGVVGL